MRKKGLVTLAVLAVIGMIGCSSPTNTQVSEVDYLRCNATSSGDMAEIELGFFYSFENMLYYADRNNMNKWIPLCNNPDCTHSDSSCNARMKNELAQKEDKLYYYDDDSACIMELSTDGSGSSKVCKVPVGDQGNGRGGRGIISQECFIIYEIYLTESGMYQRNLSRLEDDGTLHILFSETLESNPSQLTWPAYLYNVRGDFTIISSLLVDDGEDFYNVLWRVDGDEVERVNLPEYVDIDNSYLTKTTYTDYNKGEGFFEIDLESGKKTVISKNQSEDARGYVLTDTYLIECNCYTGYIPEKPYLKFFNGNEWIDVLLPDEITQNDYPFFAMSVASDRVFMMQQTIGVSGYANNIYYFMIDEENPKLTYCTTFESMTYIEPRKGNELPEFQEVDITVFDTEEYLLKVIGIGVDPEDEKKETYMIKLYCENKSSNKEFDFVVDSIAINGIEFDISAGVSVKSGEKVEHEAITRKDILELRGVDCDLCDFTNILLSAYVMEDGKAFHYDPENGSGYHSNIVNIYPYGEDKITTVVREPLSTDYVVIDNEYATVTITQYDTKEIENDTITFIIENKTDERIRFAMEEILSINGVEIENTNLYDYAVTLPKSYEQYKVVIPPNTFSQYDIKVVEEAEVLCKIYKSDVIGAILGEDALVSETVTITP